MKTFLLASITLSSSLLAQNWNPLATAGAPPGRVFPQLAHNTTSGNTLLFGGYDFATVYADTWELSGTTWTQLSPATTPPARDSHVMVHDSARNRTVLFGGLDTAIVQLTDTWEWDGTDWNQIIPAMSPPPRINAGMVFDSGRNVCVLFGGFDNLTGVSLNDTWEWDGANWSQVAGSNPPPGRDGFAMAYDATRGQTVVFGGWDAAGMPMNDTWEYDGATSTWTQFTPVASPSARYYTAMTFDAARGSCVLYGGSESSTVVVGDTWEFDGTTWTTMATPGPTLPLEAMAVVHDSGGMRSVMFGGVDLPGTVSGDTWEYSNAAIASYTTFGAGCAGSNGTPVLAAAGVPSLGSPFAVDLTNLPVAGGLAYMVLGYSRTTWNGQPLPVSLAPFGFSAACNALIQVEDGVLVINTAGTASQTLMIPSNPTLAGFAFYNQGVSFDATVPGGAAFSNAGAGIIN